MNEPNEKPIHGPVMNQALEHLNVAADELARVIRPAELAALQKIDTVAGCSAGLVSGMFGMMIGYLVSRGLSPEEIGDAATAMARITQQ